MAWRFLLILQTSVLAICFAEYHITRKLSEEIIQVECTNKTSQTIVHITAINEKHKEDVIHYLIAGISRPTIIITKHLMEPLNLTINNASVCNEKGEAFNFSSSYTDITGLIITRVFWYPDPDDKIAVNNSLPMKNDVTNDFRWKYNSGEFTATNNGSLLKFRVKVHDRFGNAKTLPHNPVHANLTEFTLVMKNLPIPDKHTRYAVEVTLFTSNTNQNNGQCKKKKTIDDEHTPGVFTIWDFLFPLKSSTNKQAFATWKPVAYNKKKRERGSQSLAFNFDGSEQLTGGEKLKKSNATSVGWTIASIPNINYYAVNITFGNAKDGCYNLQRYMSWTGMVGHGIPPKDSMSSMVLAVIIVGLGAPVVVMLVGAFVLLIRRVRLRKSNYDQIN